VAVDDQKGRLDELAVLRELVNRISPVPQDAIVAVEVRDLALAGPGVAVPLVIRDVTGCGSELPGINRFFPLGPFHDGESVVLVVNLQGGSFGHTLVQRKQFPVGGKAKFMGTQTSHNN
jgi:hypothetical protein